MTVFKLYTVSLKEYCHSFVKYKLTNVLEVYYEIKYVFSCTIILNLVNKIARFLFSRLCAINKSKLILAWPFIL